MKPHSVPKAATSSALIAALFASGCAGAKPPPLPPAIKDLDAPLVAADPVPPARWVESGGATLIGPSVGDGTLVLLGGRRALVQRDGSIRNETVPSPEPLLELLEVPSAASGAKGSIVGRGKFGLYRFDDPLGAAVTLARGGGALARIGALPGVLAAWTTRSDLPYFLDVTTGRERALPGLPGPPMRAVTFVDRTRGAAIFEVVGLVTSVDGGATWRLADAATAGDGLRMNGLRRRDAAIRAYTYAEGPEAGVDIDAGKLGVIEPPSVPAKSASPLLRWIQITGRDPLEAAASGGIDLGPRGALVASHGLLARVDPATGAILELVEFARGKWMNACSAAAADDGAFIACALSEDQGGADLFDPFGVLHVTASDPLRVDRPIVIRNGDVDLRSSPSGGAMIMGSCAPERDGEVCVRQSTGKWLPLRSELELDARGVGPLADGRIAYLRGMTDDDVSPDPEPDPRARGAKGAPGDSDTAPLHHLHVATLDAAGHERALAAITLPEGLEVARVESPIEEDVDHALHLVIEAGSQLFAVGWQPGKGPAQVQALGRPGAARIHAGRGLSLGDDHLLVSPDGGDTWSEAPAPARVRASFSESLAGERDALAVSAVGARIFNDLRLGWGPPEAETSQGVTPEPEAPLLDRQRTPAPPADRLLSCATSGAAASAGPLLGTTQIKALFASAPPRKGTRRETSAWSSGRAGMLDTIALLEEEGPDKRGSSPASWTLRWFDPTEIGARPRSLTRSIARAESAREITWGGSLRFAAASAGRSLFALHAGGSYLLIRSGSSGDRQLAEVGQELLPMSDAVFSSDRSDTIAWMHESDLIVWIAGEAPRRVAQVAAHAGRWLGQPTRDAVPVILGGPDWAITRALPIPPLDKLRGASAPAPVLPTLDGWTPAVNLRRDLGALPACGPSPRGASFLVMRSFTSVRIDSAEHGGVTSLYDVRVAGDAACVAGVSALVSPTRRVSASAAAAPAANGSKPASTSSAGPVAFVRVDLAGKRAEGGERGPAPAKVHRLTCTLDPAMTKQ
uniref:Uncharacterized protein n=1 Tax=Aetherobacter sp. TaxID=2022431 RepID=A0A3S7UV18_9BACT|nr:hypothetical protein [Aetherobacter sp.]